MGGMRFAELMVDGKTFRFPIVVGTEGEKAIDISALRKETGYVTLDPSFANTGACCSKITYVDGEHGILRYRGIPIEDLAGKNFSPRSHIFCCMPICPRKNSTGSFPSS